jgi:hypothetical protein
MDREPKIEKSTGLRTTDRVLFMLGAVFIGGYFLLLTNAAVGAYFGGDDLMNLYRSWSLPLGTLFKANILFFWASPFFRPMGSVWYRSIFSWAGFNPVPFHVANLMILLANMFLTYAVSRRLSKSRTIAAVTTLLTCFHAKFAALYFDTGYIYDVLCYFFFFAAFLFYIRVRQHSQAPGLRQLALCSILYICALNSKEMAVTLPVFLAIYELLYHPPRSWIPRELLRWGLWEGRGIFVTGVITAIFLAGRSVGQHSLLAITAYRPVFTFGQFMETNREFLDNLFYQRGLFTAAWVVLLWALLFFIAWWTKSRPLKFAWLFLMISPLPLDFVLPRGGAQYYVVLFGWTLYGATGIVQGSDYLLSRIPCANGPWVARIWGAILLGAIAIVLFPYEKYLVQFSVPSVTIEGVIYRSMAKQLRTLHPEIPPEARILFLDDPISHPEQDLNMTFLVRLIYRDSRIVVDRAKRMRERPTDAQLAGYDYVYDYRAGRVIEAKGLWRPSLMPMIVLGPEGPEYYHRSWAPVNEIQPAKPGEWVIARAADFGPTQPDTAPGQPFPQDPLATVIARVEVRINGQLTEVTNEIGWPNAVNIYRVDFRVPEDTPAGKAKVDVTVHGVTGLPATIPVR